MSTTTATKSTAAKSTAKTQTAAKGTTTKSPAKATTSKPEPKAATKAAEPKPVVRAKPYRDSDGFRELTSRARRTAKGNPAFAASVSLITHLSWKAPTAAVGWAKGTTASTVAHADDLLLPTGTPIDEAMAVAAKDMVAHAETDEQKAAAKELTEAIQAHTA